MPDISDINRFIIGGNENDLFRKVIKIYIFKLFYNLTGKNLDNMMTNYNLPKKGITFTNLLTDQTNENKFIREIICEEKLPTEKIYEVFPLLKYFIYTKYLTKEDFIQQLGPKEKYMTKYPLLYKYLTGLKDPNVHKLDYLVIFNKFTNEMIDHYSFNITREDAKIKLLKDENIYTEQAFKDLFEIFLEGWNDKKIKDQAIKYKDNPNMEVKQLSEEDQLIYFLIDINEQGFGMYLAAAYQKFISWQNQFLQFVIDNGADKSSLSSYIDNIKRRIPIHNANDNQIISINNCFVDYDNLDDCINSFSKRKIYSKNGKINYKDYNKFEYDVSSIEEELAKVLLSGKCLFEEDNDHFVTFWGEGFNGGKSDVLQKFYEKFKQTDLDKNEKEKVKNYLKIFGLKNDYKQFYSSLQLFIFYLFTNNFDENETISKILEKSNEFSKLNGNCIKFFNNENIKEIKGEKILSIFFLFEHFCFQDLCQTLKEEYKKEIDPKIKVNIEKKLLKPENYNEYISIEELGAAVRRFISRYLGSANINPDAMLLQQLKRIDLWGEKIGKLKNLDSLITNLIGEFKLKVGESYGLYDIIKEEDEKEINIENEEEEEEEEITFKRGKKKKNKKII